jgi:acyl-coenzyme A synthetase/AMP-(fatty) acid ligase
MFDSFSDNMYKFTESTKFLCVLPAVTSAFWHIVLPSFYRVGFELHLTARNQLIDDLQRTKFDATMFTPNIVDFIRNHGSSVNFDSFSGLAIGGAPVTDRHAEFLFSHGANTCINSYGTTETGSPLLARKITSNDQFYDHCNLTPLAAGVEFKLVDQELWVKSPSLCENFKSFSHDGEWRRTGDLWQQNQGLIKYVGRTDDVVKINGYTTNLLEIETWWESHQLLGECVAKVRSIGGNDYIELAHTVVIDASTKNNLKSQARNIFPECNVPAKFTLINTIPKTALGKKQRHLVTS